VAMGDCLDNELVEERRDVRVSRLLHLQSV
jgi:hypothetical protein